jgi:hypothetical protein
MDLMKSHVTRGVPEATKTAGERTLQLAVPAGWTLQAKCAGSPTWDETHGMKAGNAAQLCEGCPVIAQCLAAAMEEEHGLSAGGRYGIRGGLSPKERADLAFAERECERGHRDRWGANINSKSPVCLECKAEDFRARHAARMQDPEYRAAKIDRQRAWRESRSVHRASCLECQEEMRTAHLPRHRANKHGDDLSRSESKSSAPSVSGTETDTGEEKVA